MFALLFTVLFAIDQIAAAQKCLYHKQEQSLECWELTSRSDFSSHDLRNVTNLSVSSSNLTYLVGETFEIFEQLQILMLPGNNIKAISEDVFRKTEQLEYIDLAYNEIEYLDTTIFATNNKIAVIDLSGNQLKVLNVDVFKNLPHLETFNLRGNPIDYCEINTHFALLELRFRNIETGIDLKGCSDYYELMPRKFEMQVSEMIHYLNVFNALTVFLLIVVLFALLALLMQSKKTGGWKLPNTSLIFTKYDKLKNLSETKLPQRV